MSLVPVGGGAKFQEEKPPVGAEGEVWYKPANLGEPIISGPVVDDLFTGYVDLILPGNNKDAYLINESSDLYYLDIRTNELTKMADINSLDNAQGVESRNYLAFADNGIYVYDKNNGPSGYIANVNGTNTFIRDISDTYILYYEDSYTYIYNFQTNTQVGNLGWSEDGAINDGGNYVYIVDNGVIHKCNLPDVSIIEDKSMPGNDIDYITADSNNLYAFDSNYNMHAYDYSTFNLKWSYAASSSAYDLKKSDELLIDGKRTFDKNTGEVLTTNNKSGGYFSIIGNEIYSEIDGNYVVTPAGPKTHISDVYVSNGNRWANGSIIK